MAFTKLMHLGDTFVDNPKVDYIGGVVEVWDVSLIICDMEICVSWL